MIESGISHTFACRSLSEHVINAGLYRAASLTVEVRGEKNLNFIMNEIIFFFGLKSYFLMPMLMEFYYMTKKTLFPMHWYPLFLSIFAISIDALFFTFNNDIRIYTGASTQSARHILSTTMYDGSRRTMCV